MGRAPDRLALGWRWLVTGRAVDERARDVQRLGVGSLFVDAEDETLVGAREVLRSFGVQVPGVTDTQLPGAATCAHDRYALRLERVVLAARRLKARHVLVEGGGVDGAPELLEGERMLSTATEQTRPEVLAGIRARRETSREAAAHRAAQALHGPLRAGVPLLLRTGGDAAALLGLEETEWLLDALPELGLAFDPARALRLERLGLGPSVHDWVARVARRTRVVIAHGLGSHGAGGGHPEDDGCAWGTLVGELGRQSTWVLDLGPEHAAGDVADAVGFLAALLGS